MYYFLCGADLKDQGTICLIIKSDTNELRLFDQNKIRFPVFLVLHPDFIPIIFCLCQEEV